MKANKIILGAAHWGAVYGVGNKGKNIINIEKIKNITAYAQTHGVDTIDTATLYKNSHEKIGKAKLENFKIITKTIKFKNENLNLQQAEKLKDNFKQSLKKLGRSSAHALLVHQAKDLLKPGGGYLVDALKQLKDEKLINKHGISIYYSDNIEKILKIFKPDIIQLPLSLFDQRFLHDGTVAALAREGIEIHARSVFLQGLPFICTSQLPNYFAKWKTFLDDFSSDCKLFKTTPDQVFTSFINTVNELDGYVVGFNKKEEMDSFMSNSLMDFKDHFLKYECKDPGLLDPSQWQI